LEIRYCLEFSVLKLELQEEGRLVTGREDSRRKVLFKQIGICHKILWILAFAGMTGVGSPFDRLFTNGRNRNLTMMGKYPLDIEQKFLYYI